MKNKDWLFIIFSGLIMIVFNLESIFVEHLYMEDSSFSYEALRNSLAETHFRLNRTGITPYSIYFFSEIITYSAYLARFFIVVLSILLSLQIFKFYSQFLNLDLEISLLASIIPFILPRQTLIPNFVIGSYTVWTLLFFISVCLVFINYIDSKEKESKESKIQLGIVILGFFFAFEMFANPLIPIPFLIILLIKYRQHIETKLISIISLVIIGLRIFKIIRFPEHGETVAFSLSQILDRTLAFIHAVSPFYYKNPQGQPAVFNYIIFAILLVTSISYITIDFKRKKEIKNISKYSIGMIFSIILMACGIFPYLLSPYFAIRHTFVFGFGYILLLMSNLWILKNFIKNDIKPIFSILFVCSFLVFCGTGREYLVHRWFSYPDKLGQKLKKQLEGINVPPSSQFIIQIEYGGLNIKSYWTWSSGSLKHLLNRKDISGISGPERKFYDPVGKEKRGFSKKDLMSGITLDQPLFIYDLNINRDATQINYLLRYNYMDDDNDNEWVLYKIDYKNYKTVEHKKGVSKNELINFIEKNELTDIDIFGY